MSDVLSSRYVVIAVMGPYAGESESSIFSRKIGEIERHSFTLWHHQSLQARPGMVQKLGERASREGLPVHFVLTTSGSRGSGVDTKESQQATLYGSREIGAFSPIPDGIYVETGRRPYALVIKDLMLARGTIDLWEYSDFFGGGAVKTRQGASTVCAVNKPSSHLEDKMKSHIRDIVAYAEIIEPYSVWLR